jgi:hypothetical protein
LKKGNDGLPKGWIPFSIALPTGKVWTNHYCSNECMEKHFDEFLADYEEKYEKKEE